MRSALAPLTATAFESATIDAFYFCANASLIGLRFAGGVCLSDGVFFLSAGFWGHGGILLCCFHVGLQTLSAIWGLSCGSFGRIFGGSFKRSLYRCFLKLEGLIRGHFVSFVLVDWLELFRVQFHINLIEFEIGLVQVPSKSFSTASFPL